MDYLLTTGLRCICILTRMCMLTCWSIRWTTCWPQDSDASVYSPVCVCSPVGQSDRLVVDHWTPLHPYTHLYLYVYTHLLVSETRPTQKHIFTSSWKQSDIDSWTLLPSDPPAINNMNSQGSCLSTTGLRCIHILARISICIPTCWWRERAIVNQTNTGTLSKAMLRKLLRVRVDSIWVFPSWTELNWTCWSVKHDLPRTCIYPTMETGGHWLLCSLSFPCLYVYK